MRTRKELEEQQAANVDSSTLIEAVSAQILLIHTEVLLDIRELLSQEKPILLTPELLRLNIEYQKALSTPVSEKDSVEEYHGSGFGENQTGAG